MIPQDNGVDDIDEALKGNTIMRADGDPVPDSVRTGRYHPEA